ncbi:MAG: GNAT family N-acetyltransferase, partial [Parasulfuritortus sp.]|nr:GNAT family N-acetyltransferase [Parasulfuritortus sp.]
ALFKHLRLGIYNHPRNSIDALRIWPVELESTLGKIIHQSLLGAGFRVQTYTNSYNRFEDTRGLNYESYFAKRSANMRYNVRRRHRALERSGKLELEMVTEPSQLQEAIPQYMIVSNASWKSPASMYSLETLQLINLCAGKGCLRLGIMRFECIPVAAQFWIITGGAAHCARLAYHESYKKQAVGVVLTNFMIAHLLDQDRVNEIDFGYGPDEYKRDWMNSSRHYNGFMAFNPSTPRGRIYGIKHIPGRAVKRFIKWGLAALGWQRFKAKQEED